MKVYLVFINKDKLLENDKEVTELSVFDDKSSAIKFLMYAAIKYTKVNKKEKETDFSKIMNSIIYDDKITDFGYVLEKEVEKGI